MKKIILIGVLCIGVNGAGSVSAEELKEEVHKVEEDQPKFSGLYVGLGANVNHDRSKIKNKETLRFTEEVADRLGIENVPAGANLGTGEDVSYGAHAVVGGGYLCNNGLYLALEQEFGWARHPNKVASYFEEDNGSNWIVKSIEFATLARFGYRLGRVPGVVYLSAGGRGFRIDKEEGKGKAIFRPTFGFGYQHAISTHWSVRGDVTYTRVKKVNFSPRLPEGALQDPYPKLNAEASGHRFSAAVTFVYTF